MPHLTARSIEALKPSGRMVTVADDGMPGLELYVTKTGAKTFSLRYTLASGARRRMNLGRWPAMTLAHAREEALGAMREVARGGDPASDRLKAKNIERARSVRTLDDLAEALLAASKLSGVRPSTLAYWTWLNRKHLAPRLGSTRLPDLTAGAVRSALRDIGGAAGPTTANRAYGLMRRMVNFGLEEEHLQTNPIANVKALFEEKTRERVLNDDELRRVWNAASQVGTAPAKGEPTAAQVSRAMAIAIQLCALTLQRAGEVAGMRAGELDFQLNVWVIPAARTKGNRQHAVPLSARAVALIEEASALASLRLGRMPQADDPIFPSPRAAPEGAASAVRPVERLSLGRAMARLTDFAGVINATPHDLRRTGATAIASERIGMLSEVVARILNHAPPGLGVTAIYNRHDYMGEKRRALDAWADLLLSIVGEKAVGANVLEFRAS
jgi:integrase